MKIKVKYVQGHLYIVILEIYRWCQAAIPTFDILIGFEVMTERLNPDDEIFRVLFFSTLLPPPPPQTTILNFVSIKSDCSRFWRFCENLVEIGLVDSKKLGWKKYKPFEINGPARLIITRLR